jgi:elongation factor Ts
MEISAAHVKTLRDRTGAPMMECKRALTQANGDIAQAEIVLLRSGIAAAAKKATRAASEGSVGSYIHAGGKLGVLVEVACESDFVARTDEFQLLLHDLAMHIAAAGPRYLNREQVTPETLASEREKVLAEVQGKPAGVLEKIVEGRLAKYFEENCLLDQHFVKDDKVTIADLVSSKVAKFGENIRIRRYARFKVGEDA